MLRASLCRAHDAKALALSLSFSAVLFMLPFSPSPSSYPSCLAVYRDYLALIDNDLLLKHPESLGQPLPLMGSAHVYVAVLLSWLPLAPARKTGFGPKRFVVLFDCLDGQGHGLTELRIHGDAFRFHAMVSD